MWEGEAAFAVFNALVALVSLYCVGMFICVLAGIKFCDAVCLFVWVSVLAAMLVICFWERGEGLKAGCVGLVSLRCECGERINLAVFDAVAALVSLCCVGELMCVLAEKRFCDAVFLCLSVWVCVPADSLVNCFCVRGEMFLADCVGLISLWCECEEKFILAVFNALVALVSLYCVGEFICVLAGTRFCDAMSLSVWVSVSAALFAIGFWVRGEGSLAGCVGLVSRRCNCVEIILAVFDALVALMSSSCVGLSTCVLSGRFFCVTVILSV